MEQASPKKMSLTKQGTIFFVLFIGLFGIGILGYGWKEMLIFWPPDQPAIRALLWGMSAGALITSLFALLASAFSRFLIKKIEPKT